MTTQVEVPNEIKSKIDRDVEQLLFTKGRKYYMRLKRNKSGTGIESPYLDFINSVNIDRKEADKKFYCYLKRKYPDLIKLIKENLKDDI